MESWNLTSLLENSKSGLLILQMRKLSPREKSYDLLGVEVDVETRSHAFNSGISHLFVRKIVQLYIEASIHLPISQLRK